MQEERGAFSFTRYQSFKRACCFISFGYFVLVLKIINLIGILELPCDKTSHHPVVW